MFLFKMVFPGNGTELIRAASIINICEYKACKFSRATLKVQALFEKVVKAHDCIVRLLPGF